MQISQYFVHFEAGDRRKQHISKSRNSFFSSRISEDIYRAQTDYAKDAMLNCIVAKYKDALEPRTSILNQSQPHWHYGSA